MSSHTARERILARLHASGTEQTDVPEAPLPPPLSLDRDAKIERLADTDDGHPHRSPHRGRRQLDDKLKELAREKGLEAAPVWSGGTDRPGD
jgi:hypothetical protein